MDAGSGHVGINSLTEVVPGAFGSTKALRARRAASGDTFDYALFSLINSPLGRARMDVRFDKVDAPLWILTIANEASSSAVHVLASFDGVKVKLGLQHSRTSADVSDLVTELGTVELGVWTTLDLTVVGRSVSFAMPGGAALSTTFSAAWEPIPAKRVVEGGPITRGPGDFDVRYDNIVVE